VHQSQVVGGLGKSFAIFMPQSVKDREVDGDLGEIRRENKRRRATAASFAKSNVA